MPIRLVHQTKPRKMFGWTQAERRAADLGLDLPKTLLDPTGTEQIIFAISLIAAERAHDFGKVSELLQHTLASLDAQSDGRWRAIICGQDRPEGLVDGDRVTFLPFDQVTAASFDKNEKRRAIVDHLLAGGMETGYLFTLDADDLVHRDLVGHLLSQSNGYGHLVSRGYRVVTGQHTGIALGPRSWPEGRWTHDTLWRNCGSCANLFFDMRPGGMGTKLLDAVAYTKHGSTPHLAAILRQPLADIPFPAIVYRTNHGENRYTRFTITRTMSDATRDKLFADFPIATVAGVL